MTDHETVSRGRSLKSQPGADGADSDMAFEETFYVCYRVGRRRASPELVLQSLEWGGGEHHISLIAHKYASTLSP